MSEARRDPADIDGDYRPRTRDDLAWVELGGEMVLSVPIEVDEVVVSEHGFDTHWLDPTATVLWQCFDGTVSLVDLVDELADVVVGDPADILDDLIGLARTLGREGLLVGVEAAPRVAPDISTPGGVPVDTPVGYGDVALLSGPGLPDGGGRQVLVHWSAGCGFCAQIADDLAALLPALGDAGWELVLLARGDRDDNLALVETHGLAGAVLCEGPVDVLAGTGTPVGYLVEQGVTTSPMAVGGPNVLTLVRGAVGLDDAS